MRAVSVQAGRSFGVFAPQDDTRYSLLMAVAMSIRSATRAGSSPESAEATKVYWCHPEPRRRRRIS